MINNYKHIYFVGIKGVAQSNLAIICTEKSCHVSGCDDGLSYITDANLENRKIKVDAGFSAENLPADCDLVVFSASHSGKHNPIVQAALARKIKTIHQVELIAEIMANYEKRVAVTGCHGKTTTTSLLAFALKELGANPGYLSGVSGFSGLAGGSAGGNGFFVVEADEYGIDPPTDKTPKFLRIPAENILALNLGYDHPDVYDDIESVKAAFSLFFKNKNVFANADDPLLMEAVNGSGFSNIVTYGNDSKADLTITSFRPIPGGSKFNLGWRGEDLGTFKTGLYGEKNVSNCAAATAYLLSAGFPPEKIKDVIGKFSGTKRRFEMIFQSPDYFLYDDYAHHPDEVRATLAALRQKFAGHRIMIIFQPHTYSRTKALLKEFGESLAQADMVFLLPIFASAREKPGSYEINSSDIAVEAKRHGHANVRHFTDKQTLLLALSSTIGKGDVIVTMGAGDVYMLAQDIISIISGK